MPSKTKLHIEDKIKSFHDKQKLKEFTNRKPALQNILSKIFQEEEVEKQQCKSAKGGTTLKEKPIEGETKSS